MGLPTERAQLGVVGEVDGEGGYLDDLGVDVGVFLVAGGEDDGFLEGGHFDGDAEGFADPARVAEVAGGVDAGAEEAGGIVGDEAGDFFAGGDIPEVHRTIRST